MSTVSYFQLTYTVTRPNSEHWGEVDPPRAASTDDSSHYSAGAAQRLMSTDDMMMIPSSRGLREAEGQGPGMRQLAHEGLNRHDSLMSSQHHQVILPAI